MGWRGALRSAVAASRAIERDRRRRQNAVLRSHHKVDRLVEQLNLEIERSLDRVLKFEKRIYTHPITASGVKYDPETRCWAFTAIPDSAGHLHWKVKLEFTSDAFEVDRSITDNGRTYELIDVSVTKWAIFAAFRISATSIGSPTKLFSKTAPANNKVFIRSSGIAYRGLEGQLDLDIPIPGSMVGLVAFPLPRQQGTDLAVDFLLKSGNARMNVVLKQPTLFADAACSASLVDTFRRQIEEQTGSVYQKADEAKNRIDRSGQSSLGWILIVALIVVAVIAAVSISQRNSTTSEQAAVTQPGVEVNGSSDRWNRLSTVDQIDLGRAWKQLRELPPKAHARRMELLRKIIEIDPADPDAATQLRAEQAIEQKTHTSAN